MWQFSRWLPDSAVNRLYVIGKVVTVALALVLIFLPEARDLSALRWIFVALFMSIGVLMTWRDYRAGLLTLSLGNLHRARPQTSPLDLLFSVCGSVGLVLSLFFI